MIILFLVSNNTQVLLQKFTGILSFEVGFSYLLGDFDIFFFGENLFSLMGEILNLFYYF